jgi:RNA polymerase-binding transcription factor DksA
MRATSESERKNQSQLIDDGDRLRDLLGRLRSAATDRAEYEPHDVTDDEAALQADAIETRLEAVEAALDRIDSGEYGLCRACGSGIAKERLDAVPATDRCRACV